MSNWQLLITVCILQVQMSSAGRVHSTTFSNPDTCGAGNEYNKECDTLQTAECNLDPQLIEEIASYKEVSDKIISEVLHGSFKNRAYSDLENFIDTFGPRFSGTPTLENAIDFMLERMREMSLENVHGENASIPQWVRYLHCCLNLDCTGFQKKLHKAIKCVPKFPEGMSMRKW